MPSNVNETNPAILKAELSFYASSHSDGYEEVVYSSLKKIELMCATDYATICSSYPKDALFVDTITREALDYHKPSGLIDHDDNQSPAPRDPIIGSLGYGDAGDMCMILNYAKLSHTCQSVVADFRDLKKQYGEEESVANGNQGEGHKRPSAYVDVRYPVFAIVTFAILLFCRVRIQRRKHKMKKMRAIVTGTEANPALNVQRKS